MQRGDWMESAIVVEGLKRVFGNGASAATAVDSISFEVAKGEIFGILGPNGAGKTTTIRMLSTLLKPTSGRAAVLGTDVSDDRRARDLRRRINIVSGGERGLYYRLTGRQNLRYFADLYSVPRGIREERIDRILELVSMTDAADRPVEEYSRGMKQRIHIARALINDPEVLFLDEPTIGLDPDIALQIRRMVRTLADEGRTIILTTHYMYEAEELCDRLILLKKGRIVGYGSIGELRSKILDDDMIRVTTTSDPSAAFDSISSMEGVAGVRVDSVAGRYLASVRCAKGADLMDALESRFSEYGIRSIGFDEPTLEELYLHLTGGE